MRSPFILFALILCLPIWLRAETLTDPIIEQARLAELAQQPAWLALLHYKPVALSGLRSQADDPRFFFSEQGKTQPQTELEATIKAMLLPAKNRHAQCLFPARWFWLKQQLNFSSSYDVSCPRLDAWMDRINADRLTLVFPSMYLGNPGSSFGHTFLRFDTGDSVMLSQALNYAAENNPDDGMIAYVYNGVFGGYTGVFRIRNYFETVQVYSDIENRDIWEYQLDYSPAEIRQLARHVWEVTDINFDYFFFGENCSYRLLSLLDAAKPEGALTFDHAFPLYAIPVDTVRALEAKNLILKKQYRPSLASQIKMGLQKLSDQDRQQVIQLAEGELTAINVFDQMISLEKKIELLEQAYSLLQFRGQADTEQAGMILLARSRLSAGEGATLPPSLNQPEPPESGHASARFAYGAGQRTVLQNDKSFVDFKIRMAFHDLLDSPLGYAQGSAINVMDAHLRWLPDEDALQLESLRLFNVVSLNPVSDWTAPLSWQLDVRLQRLALTPVDSDLAFIVEGGGGYSTRLANTSLFAMVMVEADVSNDYKDDYSLLAGGQLGISASFYAGQLLLLAENRNAVSGFDSEREEISAELQFNLDKDLALRFGYQNKRYQLFDNSSWHDKEWFIRIQQYF